MSGIPVADRTPADRFWSKVDKTAAGGCWLWTATGNRRGYGKFRDGAHMVYAHRWVYEAVRGPIPDGQQIDHLCRNRRCVNPSHLELVTPRENSRRGVNLHGDDVYCGNGHERASNTIAKGDGRWVCRQCAVDATRHWRQRRREILSALAR